MHVETGTASIELASPPPEWRRRREALAVRTLPNVLQWLAQPCDQRGHFRNNPGCSKGLRSNSVTGLLAPRQNRPPCRSAANNLPRFINQGAQAAHENSVRRLGGGNRSPSRPPSAAAALTYARRRDRSLVGFWWMLMIVDCACSTANSATFLERDRHACARSPSVR
jgi:hypothetical protein